MLVLVERRLVGYHIINNLFRMGLPSGCNLAMQLAVRMHRRRGYKYTQSARWFVCLSVCLPAGVSAGLQQHDVSPGSEHSLTSVTARGVQRAPDSRITV